MRCVTGLPQGPASQSPVALPVYMLNTYYYNMQQGLQMISSCIQCIRTMPCHNDDQLICPCAEGSASRQMTVSIALLCCGFATTSTTMRWMWFASTKMSHNMKFNARNTTARNNQLTPPMLCLTHGIQSSAFIAGQKINNTKPMCTPTARNKQTTCASNAICLMHGIQSLAFV